MNYLLTCQHDLGANKHLKNIKKYLVYIFTLLSLCALRTLPYAISLKPSLVTYILLNVPRSLVHNQNEDSDYKYIILG
jgi:hypothetical protein